MTQFGVGLAAFGVLATGGAIAAFRRKLTGPFKTAYFLAWPTLGSAILILGDPGYEQQKQVPPLHSCVPALDRPLLEKMSCPQTLEQAGLLDSNGEVLGEITGTKELQMQRLREAAHGKSW